MSYLPFENFKLATGHEVYGYMDMDGYLYYALATEELIVTIHGNYIDNLVILPHGDYQKLADQINALGNLTAKVTDQGVEISYIPTHQSYATEADGRTYKIIHTKGNYTKPVLEPHGNIVSNPELLEWLEEVAVSD